jgi:hypothetical protein
MIGLNSRCRARIVACELAAVVGVLVDLPGPEDALAQAQAVLAELFLGGHAFGVRFEVACEVRPAELAACSGRWV